MLAQHRTAVIAVSVVLFHVAALWALQSGLLRRVVEVVVPVQLVSEFLPPPSAVPAPPQPVSPPPAPAKVAPRAAVAPVLPAAPQPLAVAEAPPAPSAPTGVVAPQAPAPPMAAPVAAQPSAAVPAPVKVELPSADADYLHNPKPAFPPMSRRVGEQGRVLVRVLIGADGLPQKAEIKASSGFERLDRAALTTALQWRYVPGKRAGVAETMWYVVPIDFVLE